MEILGFLDKARRENQKCTESLVYTHFENHYSLVNVFNVYNSIEKLFYIDAIKTKGAYIQINSAGINRYKRLHNMKRSEMWRELPKRYWLVIALIAYVFGLLSPLIVEWSRRKIWPESTQTSKPLPTSTDTTKKH